MARPKPLRVPSSGLRAWCDRIASEAVPGSALEIRTGDLDSPDYGELQAWRDLTAELARREIAIGYRGDPTAELLLRLVAGERRLGDLRLDLIDGEAVLAPSEGFDLDHAEAVDASAIGRHLRAVPLVVDLERVRQVHSALINWLLQLRHHLEVDRLPLRGGTSRTLVPLRQMGLEHVLQLG